jgi:formate/nitrite transporter FocA (FNT family)
MSINVSQLVLRKSSLQVFLDRYQYILSIAATFLFFSEIPDYLDVTKQLPLNPLAWIIIFSILALPFVKKIKSMPRPLIVGLLLYAIISSLSLATVRADEAAMQDFRNRILSIIFVCLMYIIYQQKSLKQVKYALLIAVLMSVCNNFYELANPLAFSELNPGRPAGFYINPTKTGGALMLGMILSIHTIKKPYRWLFVLFVGCGIMLTFTRGAIAGWLICVPLLIAGRVLSDKRRTVILPGLLLLTFLTILNPLNALSNYFGGSTDGSYWNVNNRLEQFQNPSLDDDSAKERKTVAKEAWQMFGEHPFWGNGLGSTNSSPSTRWSGRVSTHNMYLYYMADNGIIGFLFLPGAIFAVVYRNKGEQKIVLVCYVIFLSFWGFFSHNVLEERYVLSTLALLAAINASQSKYSSYIPQNFQLALPPASAQLLLPPVRNQRALPPANYQKTFPPIHK